MSRRLPIFLSVHRDMNFKSAMAELIFQILHLENRLSHPENQSVYFRWAYRNYIRDKYWMIEQYNCLAKSFNSHSVDRLIEQLEDQKRQLKVIIPAIRPIHDQNVLRSATNSRIKQYEDYLGVKAITPVLPTWTELKNSPDLITEILNL